MDTMLNLLLLDDARREACSRAAAGHEQIFAPEGVLKETGQPLPREEYERATGILGNPPPAYLAENRVLRLLQTWSAGVDTYEAPGVLPEGAILRSAVGAYGHSVSEHMFAMLLSSMKRLGEYRDAQREGRWADLGPAKTLRGARVLIVGTGDLGSSFARLSKSLGARTAGVRRDPEKGEDGVDEMHGLPELDRLLAEADVVALMLPHRAETYHIIDERRLRLMKEDAILVNGGRGTAVDCAALAKVLSEGRLRGACLDVTEPEPLPPGHPLWAEPRALLTPHVAGGYHLPDTAGRIADIALGHLKEFLGNR